MPVEHAWVRVVENRRLDAPLQQRFWLADEVLVECVLARDEHRQAVSPAPRTSPLLPQRRHGSRKPDRDRAVEQTDVDAQLEGVRRGDAEQFALHESSLDVATLCGRVAGAIGSEPLGGFGVDSLYREPVNQLRRLPTLREADGAEAARG